MFEQKKNAAFGMMLGVLLVGGTAAQASAQATQDTSKATPQDTSAYSAPSRSDTSAPAGATDTSDTSKAGTDTTGMSKMNHDSTYTDTSKTPKKQESESADSSSAK